MRYSGALLKVSDDIGKCLATTRELLGGIFPETRHVDHTLRMVARIKAPGQELLKAALERQTGQKRLTKPFLCKSLIGRFHRSFPFGKGIPVSV